MAHIPVRFFDDKELAWRTVHSWELAAIAELELGHQAEGARLVNRISNALATRGDADELTAPIDLVFRLLSCADQGDPLSRDLLDVVASSIDTSVWFSDSLSKRIQDARAWAFHGATGKPGAPVQRSSNRGSHAPGDHQRTYVCTHVFKEERPVLYVTRPDGDWCFLCGDEHPDEGSEFRVVGLGHLMTRDGSLAEVLDLAPNQEAERDIVGGTWSRSEF